MQNQSRGLINNPASKAGRRLPRRLLLFKRQLRQCRQRVITLSFEPRLKRQWLWSRSSVRPVHPGKVGVAGTGKDQKGKPEENPQKYTLLDELPIYFLLDEYL